MSLEETVVHILQPIKQFCYGYEKLRQTSREVPDGSPQSSFYATSIYHFIAVFYLIDKGKNEMGGSLYKALRAHDLQHLLGRVRETMEAPLGETNFGEVVRIFRNKILAHPKYHSRSLDRIYEKVDMEDPDVLKRFYNLIHRTYILTKGLSVQLAMETDATPEDIGLKMSFPEAQTIIDRQLSEEVDLEDF